MKNILTFKNRNAFEKWELGTDVVADIGDEYFELVYKKDGKYWVEDKSTYNKSNKQVCLKEVELKTVMVPYTSYHDVEK